MEKTLIDEAIASSSIGIVGVLFSLVIIKWLIEQFLLHLCILRFVFQSFVLSFAPRNVNHHNQSMIATQNACTFKKECVEENKRDLGDKKLCLEELPSVMEKVERFCGDDESNEIADLFGKEPSLEEVKDTFNLFDENTDGFIDAGEIKKVLHVLGFVQASESECRRMIKTFDHNGDERIDFDEFAKLMEDSFC